MEKDRSAKVLAIVGLVVAVVALSVGFAAFTQTLTINSSAEVNPANTTLDVEFTATNPVQDPAVTAVTPAVSPAESGATATNATLSGDGLYATINNIHATFTDKGQSATYTFYVHNASAYVAYLRSVTFNNATSGSAFKVCTPGTDTTATTVNNATGGAACDDVSLTLTVGSDSYTASNTTLSGKSLAVGAYDTVTVTIAYDGEHALPDGDFTVDFGSITLGYSSVDAA